MTRRAPDAAPAHLLLPPDLAAVRTARAFVRDRCRAAGVADDVRDVAMLLASECVTNAFMHGRSEARLSVTVGAGRVLVEVGDDNSRHPAPVVPDPDALDGRGLAIVASLASAWGTRDQAYGKVIWFEVPLG